MKWLRFYYFTFLYHYRNKPESWAGELRSLLLVELSICWLMLSLLLIFDPGLDALGSATKPLILFINVIILIALHSILMSKGRSEAIFKKYKESSINTTASRSICWAIWAGSLIVFFLAASLQQGI
jgi:hypothetical protein